MITKMKLNPNKEVVKSVKEGLKRTGGYCPCLIEQTDDTKCPCKDMRENQDCHCGLFIKEEIKNPTIPCVVDGEDIILPKYETVCASGMDLRAWKYSLPNNLKEVLDFGDEGFVLKPHSRVLIKTGIHIELPENVEAQIRPRSGLSLKEGIVAQIGTIDEDYRGDLGLIILNTSDKEFVIKKGDRLAQIVFMPVLKFDLKVVDKLSTTVRGDNGFGSTNKGSASNE